MDFIIRRPIKWPKTIQSTPSLTAYMRFILKLFTTLSLCLLRHNLPAYFTTKFIMLLFYFTVEVQQTALSRMLCRTCRCVMELKDNNKFICFQSNTTIFCYSTYWRQASVTRPTSGHLYIQFKIHGIVINAIYKHHPPIRRVRDKNTNCVPNSIYRNLWLKTIQTHTHIYIYIYIYIYTQSNLRDVIMCQF
jgi:hypothetical protein